LVENCKGNYSSASSFLLLVMRGLNGILSICILWELEESGAQLWRVDCYRLNRNVLKICIVLSVWFFWILSTVWPTHEKMWLAERENFACSAELMLKHWSKRRMDGTDKFLSSSFSLESKQSICSSDAIMFLSFSKCRLQLSGHFSRAHLKHMPIIMQSCMNSS
jgi:hypothetical protein